MASRKDRAPASDLRDAVIAPHSSQVFRAVGPVSSESPGEGRAGRIGPPGESPPRRGRRRGAARQVLGTPASVRPYLPVLALAPFSAATPSQFAIDGALPGPRAPLAPPSLGPAAPTGPASAPQEQLLPPPFRDFSAAEAAGSAGGRGGGRLNARSGRWRRHEGRGGAGYAGGEGLGRPCFTFSVARVAAESSRSVTSSPSCC